MPTAPDTAEGPTVAEQLAALPPLSQLLGIDTASSATVGAAPVKQHRRKAAHTAAAAARTALPTPRVKKNGPSEEAVAFGIANTSTMNAPKAARSHAPPLPSPTRHPGGLREWRHVQSTLQLPLPYRSEEDIRLTLRLLRSLPHFAPLLDHDLLTLTETMALVEVPEAGTVVLRKRAEADLPLTTSRVHEKVAMEAPLLLSPSQIENEDATAPRPAWRMPAAELFDYFKKQMEQGDAPSLPFAEQGGVSARAVSSAPLNRPETPGGALAKVPLTVPLLSAPENWRRKGDAEAATGDPFVLLLISGHCELRWPRQRCPSESPDAPGYHTYQVQPGDAMAYALLWVALPPGAHYVAAETCMLLRVSADGQTAEIRERLQRACHRADEAVRKAQLKFLAHELHVPLFAAEEETEVAPPNTRAETGDAAASSSAYAARGQAPSVKTLLDAAARYLIPVRVPNGAVVLREGLSPVTECALFFVAEGSLSVGRRLWSPDQQRLEARQAQLVRELTPPNGVRHMLSAPLSTTTMEVAQLRAGDYCGDLAYLRVDVDHATSIDAEWTDAYWQSTFVARAAEGSVRNGGEHGALLSPASSAATVVSKSLFRRHKSTVTAQQSSRLYVLLPSAAAEVVRGAVLARMLHHAHTYHGYATLLAEYERLFKWSLYKEKVLWEESKRAPVCFR